MKNKIAYQKALSNLPQGVQAAEVYAQNASSFEVDLRDHEIQTYDISHSDAVCLRVDCGQIGYAYSEAPQEDPQRLLTLATQNAACVSSDDAQFMRFYEGDKEYPACEPIDERLLRATAEEKIKKAYELESLTLAQDISITHLENCSISTSSSETEIFNSLGLSLSQQTGFAAAYVAPVATKNGQTKNGFAFDIARCIEELDLLKVAREATEDVLAQFDAHPIPSNEYNVLIKNKAFVSLIGVFVGMFSADAAQKGLSLLANREGEQIAADIVSFFDDPMYEKSLFHQPFDSEGVAAKHTQVIKNGKLCTLLHNRKTAAKAGTITTGSGRKGGVGGSIGVGIGNFVLEPGIDDFDTLCEKLQNGVYITSFSGLNAGANPISGDFSLLCRGFEIRDGKILKPVEQITVAGNFLALLQSIVNIGNDLYLSGSAVGTPSVIVNNMQIAGT